LFFLHEVIPMPISNIAEYHRPQDIDSALRLLREGKGRAVPVAGGTSLVGIPPRDVEVVVDLHDLKLDWILAGEDGGLSLGAMVTLATLVDRDEARDYAGGILAEATRYTAANLVRNRATLGGTLVSRAASSDLVAALLALDATVTVVDTGEQTVSLSDLYRRREYLLQPGALITEVTLPAMGENSQARLERIARTPMDQPILSVAAVVTREGDRISTARVAATGFGSSPARLSSLEEALQGQEWSGEVFEAALAKAGNGLSIKDDHLASAEYRRAMLPVLARRALEGAES
jgi:probable selenate reductase FAD-binding subunit